MATEREQFIVDARGRRKAVILPIGRYRRILEDLQDLAVIAERRDEPTKRRLRADGLVPD